MGETNRIDIWSRRSFIKATAPLLIGNIGSQRGLAAGMENSRLFAYVGSYTSAVDGGANGEGIYRFAVNARTGALTQRKLLPRHRILPGS